MKITGRGATTNAAWQDAMRQYDQHVSPELRSWICAKHWNLDTGFKRTPVTCEITVAISTDLPPK